MPTLIKTKNVLFVRNKDKRSKFNLFELNFKITSLYLFFLQHQLDLNELKSFLEQSTRKSVKELLSQQAEKVQEEINKLKKLEQDRIARQNAPANTGAYTKKM